MTSASNPVHNKRARGLLVCVLLVLVGYFVGGLTVYKQLFPFEHIRYVKNVLLGGSLQKPSLPKPRNSLFETFQPEAEVVMIGDSITQGAEWRDIFPGISIVNRGIGGDRADDILRRMDPIFAVKPKKAFVMVGINDIYWGLEVEEIFGNYVEIVRQLKEKNIEVYIQSTVECSKDKCGDNLTKVRLLNKMLTDYASQQKINYIDINEGLISEKDGLLSDYTYDGIHLLGSGYLIWSRKISPLLAKEL